MRRRDCRATQRMDKFLHEFFGTIWWGLRTLWWDLWWSPAVRLGSFVLWLFSLVLLLREHSPGSVFLFELASAVTVVLSVVPLLWSVYRLYTRVCPPARAAWYRSSTDISKELRSDWMRQIPDLGFNLAGYLTKDSDNAPYLALFVNSENCDSAHISRVAGKDLLVFKTRFADGFAFETSNTATARLLPAIPYNPVFRFPSVILPLDLYRVHRKTKVELGVERTPVIADGDGEIAEFISRAEVVRSHMMSRDYRLHASSYRFTVVGAIRHALLLTWPLKSIRDSMFRRKMLDKLTRLGFQIDKSTGRIVAW